MDKGWIKLHRTIQNCFLWDNKPFDKCRAWIDLLLLANHEDKKILFNGYPILITRGQYLTSIRKLSDRWGWSYDKVLRFLDMLESEEMLIKDSNKNRTLLTVVNYEIYQSDRTPISEQTEHSPNSNNGTNRTATSDKQEYKELKNEKNEKNKYILSDSVAEIVEYLNLKTNSHYKPSTSATKRHIEARLNEKFTVDDFKTVIDNMVTKWGNDPKMSQYLRPETLFGSKFEGYLNQPQVNEYDSKKAYVSRWDAY